MLRRVLYEYATLEASPEARATAVLIAVRGQLVALDQIGSLTRAISLSQKEVKLEPHEHEKFSR